MFENLLKGCKVSVIKAPTAAAVGTIVSSILDMQGWEGVMFLVPLTSSLATGTATLKAFVNTANSTSGMAELTGNAVATCVADDDIKDKALLLDVFKPTKRYIEAKLITAVANIAVSHILAIQYGPRTRPTVQPTSVAASALLLSPAEV
jgi:hypothetical protein